ncbi:DUF3015 family protein [Leptospira sarikeiensis]|uniref:DUF3015 domain-containing protein n=1 Tax=Leptospira sarikeiensis TaxID=2484943 RepID=A0A4R9KDE3_9LEPT|nr:DUF3015 family protein [Leptospira sarikeiensis]TGL64131.1 DUF3015 domain-containing protein [Leptospira sarikeiensis]
MNKKLLAIGLVGLFSLASGISVSAADYGVSGCGIGALLIKDNKTFQQVLSATTNGTSGNQTSGITTGTLNCTTDGLISSTKTQEAFVALNFESLEQEMANGKGERLEALSGLLGCSGDSTVEFGELTRKNYSSLFHKEATPSSLLAAVKEEIKSDAKLSRSCNI